MSWSTLILSETLLLVFITLKKWILPIDSIVSRYNDLNLRHCVNQIML